LGRGHASRVGTYTIWPISGRCSQDLGLVEAGSQSNEPLGLSLALPMKGINFAKGGAAKRTVLLPTHSEATAYRNAPAAGLGEQEPAATVVTFLSLVNPLRIGS